MAGNERANTPSQKSLVVCSFVLMGQGFTRKHPIKCSAIDLFSADVWRGLIAGEAGDCSSKGERPVLRHDGQQFPTWPVSDSETVER